VLSSSHGLLSYTILDDLFAPCFHFCILRMFSNVTCYQIVLYSCALSREGEQYLEENRQGPWTRDMGKEDE